MIRHLCLSLAVIFAAISPRVWGAGPVDPAEFAARTIVRLTLFDLRLTQEQTPADLELAWEMLGVAQRLAPQDEHIARMRLEAAFGMGDPDAVLEQTKHVLRLDPDDEVAKLRLITSQITSRQTADARLAVYDGLVGERGEKAGLSPAIRSRLAFDAAMLKREQGDLDGFVSMLDKAVALDSTNKEAAVAALAFYSESIDDREGRLDLLANLLYADPVDPSVHDSIMRELAAAGAWNAATRFYSNEVAIMASAGRGQDEALATNGLVIEWQRVGPAQIVQALNVALKSQRETAEQNIRYMVREGQPIDGLPLPDDIRLPVYQDLIRVLAADAAGDEVTLDAAMADMTATAAFQIASLSNPQAIGQELSPEQIETIAKDVRNRLTTVRLWVGRQLELVEKELADADAARGSDDEPLSITGFRGWLALRKGDPAAALTYFEACGDGTPFINLGVALAQIELGLEPEGLEGLASLARGNSLTPLGAWARNRYDAVAQAPLTISSDAERMEVWARGVPRWLDTMALRPNRFITFEVEQVERVIGVLERGTVRVRIRNTSRIPLGFGPGRPISSRIMIVPRTDVGIENMAGGFDPEVFDIQRRLRLNPLETIEVEIWPDPGQAGFFTELTASVTSRTRWRAVQGYTVTEDGVHRPGPMGLSDETNSVVTRLPLAETDHKFDELARRIREDSEASLPVLLGALRARIQEFVGAGAADEAIAEAVGPALQAVLDRYPTCSPTGRLLMAVTMQSAFFFRALEPFEAMVKADEDPSIRMLAMFYRVTDPEDPILAEAAASGDPDLERVAALIQQRLDDNRPMVAKMRPRGRR